MISIIEHIEYLMACNDCVIIPGWGALIAHHEDSDITSVSHSMSKPRRNICFNASVAHNDGLLAQSIVKRTGISFDEATKQIADNIHLFRKLMGDGSEVPFGSLGFFRNNDNGQIEFIPFFQKNARDEYFGLKSRLSIKTLASIRAEQEKQNSEKFSTATAVVVDTNFQPTTKQISKSQKLFRNTLRIAASIIVLITLYFTLSTPLSVDLKRQDMASISVPEIKQQPQQHIVVTNNSRENSNTSISEASSSTEIQGKYFLVVSTFKSEAQANKFIADNSELSLKVRKKGSTYRVYVDNSDDYCKLVKEIDSLPKHLKGAWVSD